MMNWNTPTISTGIELMLSPNQILEMFKMMLPAERSDILYEIIQNLDIDEFYNLRSWVNDGK